MLFAGTRLAEYVNVKVYKRTRKRYLSHIVTRSLRSAVRDTYTDTDLCMTELQGRPSLAHARAGSGKQGEQIIAKIEDDR